MSIHFVPIGSNVSIHFVPIGSNVSIQVSNYDMDKWLASYFNCNSNYG